MKRPEADSPEAQRRAQTAADWLVRRDRGLTAAEQDEFLDWLAADPRHAEWLALHRQVVADFTALAHWRPEHSEEPNPDLLARPRRRIYQLAPALLAAAALVFALFWWRTPPALPGSAIEASTEFKHLVLEDGSSVELNHGALVTTKFSAMERRATLVRGEALFTVAKNPGRPFIVRAGGVDVRAVGTAFSVRLDPAAVEVLVTEGRVALARSEEGSQHNENEIPSPVSPPPPHSSEISAGQRATVSLISAKPPHVVAVTPQAIAQHLNWKPQLLDFSSAPLSAAVAEFNRRNRVQLILADAELAAMPIVAAIRSDNVEGFAKFLATAPGVEIERRGAFEIIVRRKR